MMSQKGTIFFSLGRKRAFTLALFVLVFAAVCVVGAQAGTGDSVVKWLWSANDDGLGNVTGIGWISMNCTNFEIALGKTCKDKNDPTFNPAVNIIDYGVNIPATNDAVIGYAWSSNIGWVDFNPQDHCGSAYSADCTDPDGGSGGVFRSGDSLIGWARIVSIAQASAFGNSGGWTGWISLSGPGYGVNVKKMTGDGAEPTYAWSELGWIDFSWASFPQDTVTLQPASFDLREFLLPSQDLFVTVRDSAGDPVSGKIVNLSNSNLGRFNLGLTSCTTNTSGECPVNNISASDFTSSASTTIVASCASCTPDSSDGDIIKTPDCNISCPDSFTVTPDGNWYNYSCDVSSPTGDVCNLDSCAKLSGGSSKISIQKGIGNTCDVKADPTARYDTAISRARAGTKYDNTNINVKVRGWIETN